MTLLPWNSLKMRFSAKKTVMVNNIFQMICVGHFLQSPGPYQQTLLYKLVWKNAARFYNHCVGMRSCLLKNNFKCSLQKHHFVYVYEVIFKYYQNFITCLYFPLPLNRWNSSHCHLMELFKSKESFKEKVDLNNNWKTAMPRMILGWHLFLIASLGFVWKMLSFVGKHLSFYPKEACSFSVIFIQMKRS